jgi:hypothetical protein
MAKKNQTVQNSAHGGQPHIYKINGEGRSTSRNTDNRGLTDRTSVLVKKARAQQAIRRRESLQKLRTHASDQLYAPHQGMVYAAGGMPLELQHYQP